MVADRGIVSHASNLSKRPYLHRLPNSPNDADGRFLGCKGDECRIMIIEVETSGIHWLPRREEKRRGTAHQNWGCSHVKSSLKRLDRAGVGDVGLVRRLRDVESRSGGIPGRRTNPRSDFAGDAKSDKVLVLTADSPTPISFKNQLIRVDKEANALADYLVRREQVKPTAAAHYELGLWCEAKRLKGPALIHYRRTAEIDDQYSPRNASSARSCTRAIGFPPTSCDKPKG